jgi:uncharacterized repeat protein (TIGR01451 family)
MTSRTFRLATALTLALAHAAPAFATINNTVTVTANGPGGPIPPVTATENVDVINANPLISINKTHTFAPGGDLNSNGLVDAGDVILFNYAVTNTGNVTLANVVASDTLFEGTGTAPAIAPGNVATLAPGALTNYTATYTVVAGDLLIPGQLQSRRRQRAGDGDRS